MRVPSTILPVENIKYYISLVCVCSLRYLACNVHAAMLSSMACPPLQYFSRLPHNRHDFRKTLLNIKCVFWFSLNFIWNISYSNKNWARYDQIHILVSMWSTSYSCRILMKLEFSRHIFPKILKYQIPWIPSTGSRVVSCGRTDRLTAITKLIVRFFANFRTSSFRKSCLIWYNMETCYKAGQGSNANITWRMCLHVG